jgi:threonine synthase
MTWYVTHLESAIDGSRLDAGRIQTTHQGRPLWVRYDLGRIRSDVQREAISRRGPTLWRYRELLPLPIKDDPVSLGEGMTPIIHCLRLGAELGLSRLYVKDESQLPTGSPRTRRASTKWRPPWPGRKYFL